MTAPTTTSPRSLTEAERAVMRAVMNRLVPPVDDLPGAGTMGLLAEVEAMAIQHPPFHRALLRLLEGLAPDVFLAQGESEQTAALRACETAEPAVFNAVLEVVYLAYYGDARVHQRIGWRSGPLQPRGFSLPPFDEAILEKARQRAPFWRPVQS